MSMEYQLKSIEFFYSKASLVNQFSEQSRTKFSVLRNGQSPLISGFCHQNMRAFLTDSSPARFLEFPYSTSSRTEF